MANNNYEADSLIGKYISTCEQAGHSLNETQINLLEKTLNNAFLIKRHKSPPIDIFRKIDNGILNEVAYNRHSSPGRLINVLKKYRVENLGITDNLHPNEAEAWSLYCLTSQELKKTTYKALKEKHGLAKTYGWSAFGMLHEYFKERGILDEDVHFPIPIDAQ